MRMKRTRPLSLTIIAWLFIIVGLLSAWDVISGFWQHRLSLNLGVLCIFLGRGLLQFRPAALSWAVFLTVLGLFSLAAFLIIGFFSSGEVRLWNEVFTGRQRVLVIVSFAAIYATLLAWMIRVLTRRDVKELFQSHETCQSSGTRRLKVDS